MQIYFLDGTFFTRNVYYIDTKHIIIILTIRIVYYNRNVYNMIKFIKLIYIISIIQVKGYFTMKFITMTGQTVQCTDDANVSLFI